SSTSLCLPQTSGSFVAWIGSLLGSLPSMTIRPLSVPHSAAVAAVARNNASEPATRTALRFLRMVTSALLETPRALGLRRGGWWGRPRIAWGRFQNLTRSTEHPLCPELPAAERSVCRNPRGQTPPRSGSKGHYKIRAVH